MPRVVFTRNLERHLSCPASEVAGATVRDALQGVFTGNPRLRSYILDDQGRLRSHVSIFVNGEMVRDSAELSDPVESGGEIFVMQALAGG
ncbi:MAG: MoaD/ThiS family protein [Thermoanaerobaculia bacterium]